MTFPIFQLGAVKPNPLADSSNFCWLCVIFSFIGTDRPRIGEPQATHLSLDFLDMTLPRILAAHFCNSFTSEML